MKQINILMITCHDIGRHLGCYGIPTVHTPHIDALAADGVRFTQAFCTAPQCSPSRAALFTGRYPHSNGVMGLTHADFAWDLHPEEQHLGQILQANGYETVLIGVHHESRRGDPQQVAARCGMTEAISNRPGEVVSDLALKRLARFADEKRPFYLQLGYTEPHRLNPKVREEPDYMGFIGDYIEPDSEAGITVPPYLRDEPQALEELSELQGAIRYVDTAVGRVLAGLHELGLEGQTLVILTSDHGVALPRAKCSLYDPGLETALIMRLPSRDWCGGKVHSELISNIDVFPTLLEAIGLPVSDQVQGRSFLPLLEGRNFHSRDSTFAEMTYHNYYDPRRCIRTNRYKLIVNFSAAPAFMDPSQSWRPRTMPLAPVKGPAAFHAPIELYDLQADPLELENLADDPSHEDIRRACLVDLHRWMHMTDDPLLHGAVMSPLHERVASTLASADETAETSELTDIIRTDTG